MPDTALVVVDMLNARTMEINMRADAVTAEDCLR